MTTLNKLKSLIENGQYYEYTKAADPIGSGAISKIPFAEFGSELYSTRSRMRKMKEV